VRYGIISDIHSNWEALGAVLRVLREEEVEYYLCPGDLVGYGADPNLCVEEIRRLPCAAVLGNHDAMAMGREAPDDFNPNAREAVLWTREVLKEDHKRFLKGLPLQRKTGEWFLVHATPGEPESWHYLLSWDQGSREFSHFQEPVCLFGHTHHPFALKMGAKGFTGLHDKKVRLEPGSRYLLNMGSIGQPRDGDPRAAYGIFDSGTQTVEFRRVEYDVATAQRKIRDAGLPPFLAERLSRGV
jgi:diadenosine tetraphosphatase ApaH/serine/threonine PP2A family protein phosphatase